MGHAVMYNIYNHFPITSGDWLANGLDDPCSPHRLNKKMGEGCPKKCAWSEGWAHLWAIFVKGVPNYHNWNLETPTWGTPDWDEGDEVEGRVAGALWDIFDDVDDYYTDYRYDQYDGVFGDIWDTFYNQDDDNFQEFWNALKTRLGGDEFDAPRAIFQNTIDYGDSDGVFLRVETELIEDEEAADDVIVAPVNIKKIKDRLTGNTIPGVTLSAYDATATYEYDPPDGIEMLAVREGEAPFDDPQVDIFNNDPGGNDRAEFSQEIQQGTPTPPIKVAYLVPCLIGSVKIKYPVDLNFDSINAAELEDAIPQENEATQDYQRGDAKEDGTIDDSDQQWIQGYCVGNKDLDDLNFNGINAASPKHDGDAGDLIDSGDALMIAQYLAGYRDDYLQWEGKGSRAGSPFVPVTDGKVTVEIGSARLPRGGSAVVPITVKGILTDSPGLGGYDLRIAFDPEVVRVEGIKPGCGAFAEKPVANIDNAEGIVFLNGVQPEIPGPTGDVTVVCLSLTATGQPTDTAALELSIITLVDSLGNHIPATDVDGMVTIHGGAK